MQQLPNVMQWSRCLSYQTMNIRFDNYCRFIASTALNTLPAIKLSYHNICSAKIVKRLVCQHNIKILCMSQDLCFHFCNQTLGLFWIYFLIKILRCLQSFRIWILQIKSDGVRQSLLTDLLQKLTGGLPGDSFQPEQTNGEPLTQQALQSAIEVLQMKFEIRFTSKSMTTVNSSYTSFQQSVCLAMKVNS